jgi:hypothetical protein
MTSRFLGALMACLVIAPAGADDTAAIRAAHEAHRTKVWPRRVMLRVRGEACSELAMQVAQQLMTRVRPEEGTGDRPLSAFADDCTLAELRDGLAVQFGWLLEPYGSAESLHFRICPLPAKAPTSARKPAAQGKRPGKVTRPAVSATSPPKTGRSQDPLLSRRLDLSGVEVDDEQGGLPVILEVLSERSGIKILADHTPRGMVTPEGMGASAFLAQLNGLPLGEALDRTARAFEYRWSRSGPWFLLKPAK